MIFNLTEKPYFRFTAAQRLATHAEVVLHHPCRSIEEFDEWTDRIGLQNISMIIVRPETKFLLFNNDVLNRVTCPVVTLDVEVDDRGVARFVEYNPDEV